MDYQTPVKLTSPRVWRTYLGGSRIDAIHGRQGEDSQFPEEWILSVVNARNAGREHISDEGLCYLSGTEVTLRDCIAANPEAALGKAHAEKWGTSTGVLVKIIDSAERLTVQAHPNKEQAKKLFGSDFGKTECWHILGCREEEEETPCIYMGFREGITREYWQEVFHNQDIPAMLACLHRFEVKPGETYLIRGGVPHAIGAGCLLVEIQEPTDYTVRTERVSPKGLKISDHQCHQGLGFEKMFDCFDYQGLAREKALESWCIRPHLLEETDAYRRWVLIGQPQTDCFRLERYEIRGSCEISCGDTMCGLYVIQGQANISAAGVSQTARQGDQFFVPAACASFTVQAETEPVVLFRCLGPGV